MAKAPIQAFADNVSSVFVPVVVCLALVTFAIWYAVGVTVGLPPEWNITDVFSFSLLKGEPPSASVDRRSSRSSNVRFKGLVRG